ncbi:retinal pigment epithelial membrane family protein [Mycobacterium kansasii]|uniref:Dioxygenase n=1 Tax=Mycobacterium kansasii TaxID=1768 RepID=A0A1V3WEZ9_MYCKA|nr:retinal pigment epithelial membrane family protein [Mycobacterium kansasii]
MLSLGANTSVLSHAGRTLALVEGGVANYELTEDLDTVGTCDFDGTLTGGYTAHPHRDPGTGELHAVSYSFARGRTVQYSVIDTQGRARRTVDIEVTGSPMMHDFSLTDKYVVIYDLPVTFDVSQVLPAKLPRWLSLPAQLVMQALIGHVRVPGPIAAMMNRNPSRLIACPTPGTPTIRPASESCPETAAMRTSGGSTSNPATSITRSTPTPKPETTGPSC